MEHPRAPEARDAPEHTQIGRKAIAMVLNSNDEVIEALRQAELPDHERRERMVAYAVALTGIKKAP